MTDGNKDQNRRVIAEHIETMRPKVCALLDVLFEEISNMERIQSATYPQLVTAIQTLTKTFEDEEQKTDGEGTLKNILGNYFDKV